MINPHRPLPLIARSITITAALIILIIAAIVTAALWLLQ